MDVHPLHWISASYSWVQIPGYLGAVLVIISFLMKTMVPLRVITILSNVCFIIYSGFLAQYPALFMYVALLVLNAVRIYQITLFVRRVRSASQGEQTLGALKPFMRPSHFKAGEIVFRKDDPADNLYYLVSGQFCVTEVGKVLTAGDFVGEMALLAPKRLRRQTVMCVAGGEVLSISYEHVTQLYYDNPDFGYHLLKLTTGRLFQNLDALQTQVETLQGELARLRTRPPGSVVS